MAENGFSATYSTLGDLGKALRDTTYDSAEMVGRLRHLTVPASAFGTRPEAQKAHKACTQTVQTETDRLNRQTQVLGDVTGGVDKGLEGYRGFAEGWAKKLSAEQQNLQSIIQAGE
jgi:hypothetical protein